MGRAIQVAHYVVECDETTEPSRDRQYVSCHRGLCRSGVRNGNITEDIPSGYFVHTRTNQDDITLTKVLELLQSSQIRRMLANQGLVDESISGSISSRPWPVTI